MIRALWFLIRIIGFVGIVLWVVGQQGDVEIDWLGYHIRLHLSLFFGSIVGLIIASIFIYNFLSAIIKFPSALRRYKEVKALEQGQKALTIGLAAVAAGDTKTALKQAKKASQLMPDDTGLPMLLQAQAARLDGREEDAQKHFVKMLENKDASFLGVRGLLQAALDRREYRKALDLARTALKTHPKQPWILTTVYELELGEKNWDEARVILKRAVKTGVIDPVRAQADRVAMFTAEAAYDENAESLLKKALKIDAGFVPAACQLAEIYQEQGKKRAAMRVIQKAWKTNPHPELLDMWEDLGQGSKVTPVKWREKLGRETFEGASGKAWVCVKTGRVFERWYPFTEAHGRFNTIVWDYPRGQDVADIEELDEDDNVAFLKQDSSEL